MDYSNFLMEGGDYRSFPLLSLKIKEEIILLEKEIKRLRTENSNLKDQIISYQQLAIKSGKLMCGGN